MLLSLQAVLPLLDLCDFFYASVPAHTHYNVMLLSAPRVSYTGELVHGNCMQFKSATYCSLQMVN
jgi:hypothetical protein